MNKKLSRNVLTVVTAIFYAINSNANTSAADSDDLLQDWQAVIQVIDTQ